MGQTLIAEAAKKYDLVRKMQNYRALIFIGISAAYLVSYFHRAAPAVVGPSGGRGCSGRPLREEAKACCRSGKDPACQSLSPDQIFLWVRRYGYLPLFRFLRPAGRRDHL
jgi:hypothetical protein